MVEKMSVIRDGGMANSICGKSQLHLVGGQPGALVFGDVCARSAQFMQIALDKAMVASVRLDPDNGTCHVTHESRTTVICRAERSPKDLCKARA